MIVRVASSSESGVRLFSIDVFQRRAWRPGKCDESFQCTIGKSGPKKTADTTPKRHLYASTSHVYGYLACNDVIDNRLCKELLVKRSYPLARSLLSSEQSMVLVLSNSTGLDYEDHVQLYESLDFDCGTR